MPRQTSKILNKKRIRKIVWEALQVDDWMHYCTMHYPENRWEASGNTIKGMCPYHTDDHSPSFFIYIDKRYAKCYGASCNKYENDPVALYAKLSKQNYYKAALELNSAKQLKLFNKENVKEYEDKVEANKVCEIFHNTCHSVLIDAYYNKDDPDFEEYQPAVKYIEEVRKISFIPDALPMGVVPSERILERYIPDPKDRLDVVKLLDPIKDVRNIGQLVFTYRYSIDRVAYFRIRKIKDIEGNFVEGVERDKTIVILHHPLLKSYDEDPAVFGLDYYKDVLGKSDVAYIVEGEFDWASIVTNQINEGLTKDIFLAIGGGASCNLNGIESLGIKYAHLLMDSPEAKGEALAYKIIKNNEGVVKPYVYKWGLDLIGDDPDDIIHKNEDSFLDIYKHFTDISNYYNEEEFILKKINNLIEREEDKGRKIPDADKVRYIAGEIQAITDTILSSTLIPKVSDKFKLDKNDIITLIKPKHEDHKTFLKKLSLLFEKKYDVLGTLTNARGSDAELVLWNKAVKSESKLSIARMKESASVMCKEVGSFYTWIHNSIGVPYEMQYFVRGDLEIERPVYDIEKDLEKCFNIVLRDDMKGKVEIKVSEGKKNGIFWLKHPHEDKKEWYLLNGKNLYYGQFVDNKEEILWTQIERPIYNDYYFLLSGKGNIDNWTPCAQSEKDMNSNVLSIDQMWDSVYNIMKTCFNFKYNADYFTAAAMCLYTPVFPIFEKNVFLNVSGETSSGKSRYTFGIFGGKTDANIHLIDTVTSIQDYTEAGMRQNIQGNNLACCLDEFEDSGGNDPQTRTVKTILKTIRSADTGTKVIKGTPSGESKEFEIDIPIIIAGVRPLTNPVDVNRFINITTQKKQGFQDTSVLIRKIMTKKEVKHLKKSLTIGLFKYSHRILKYYKEIKEHTSSGDSTYMGVPYRTLSQLFPLAAVISAVHNSLEAGIDYMKGYIEDRGQELKIISSIGHTPQLWTELLHSQVFKLGRSSSEDKLQRDYNLIGILQNPTLREQLVDYSINGVKIYETSHKNISKRRYYLIISWEESKDLFKRKSEFCTYPVSKLKEVAERDDKVLKEKEIKTFKNWRYVLRENLKFHELTVIEVTDIVRDGNIGYGEEELVEEILNESKVCNTSSSYNTFEE